VTIIAQANVRSTDARPTHAVPHVGPTPDVHQRYALQLLGGFDLTVDGEPVDLPSTAQRLIAFLALRRRPQTRLCIAGNLWPEKNDTRATANLRSTLWRSHFENGESVLQCKGSMVGIINSAWLDVWHIESVKPDSVVHDFKTNGRPHYERLFDDLLPGWYDDWVILERERLAQLQLRIAEALAHAVIEDGDYISATDIAYRTIALDPLGDTKTRILNWIP
jgi:DNA-binding SARP family transcriptional activator